MKILNEFLNDLAKIEKVLLVCHGPHGRSALIQSSASSSADAKSVLLTNDCITILNSLHLKNSHLYNLVTKSIQKYSESNGDNCKAYFIYVCTFFSLFVAADSSASHSTLYNSNELRSVIRTTSVASLNDLICNKLAAFKSENFVSVKNESDFHKCLDSLSVLNDLRNFNRSLSNVSTDIIKRTIKLYTKHSSTSNESFVSDVQNSLRAILSDLKYMLFYSDVRSLEDTRLLTDGFLIDKPFLLKFPAIKQDEFKCIFLSKRSNQIFAADSVVIELSKSFDLGQDFADKLYLSEASNLCFSKKFLSDLKTNEVSVVLAEGGLSEIKKMQLSAINCSLVAYLDKDYINFICSKLGKAPVELENNEDSTIDTVKNVVHVVSIEEIDKNKVYFFKHKTPLLNTAFVHFCSPIRLNFNQFKDHFRKVIKTVLNIFESEDCLICKCNYFELSLVSTFQSLQKKTVDSNERILYSFFVQFFINIYSKFNRIRQISLSQKSGYFFDNQETTEQLCAACADYEPFSLKLKCFIETFSLLKTILQIDNICFIKSSLKTTHAKSDEGSD